MSSLFNEQATLDLEDIASRKTSGDEIFSAQSGNIGTRTRITSRRVTNSNRVRTAAGSEVTLMHTLSVTTTRSWGSPRVESAPINNDGHAVFGLDLINAIPTSSDLFGWVNYLDALIKDQNIGFEKSEVDADTATATDQRGNNNFVHATIESALSDETNTKSDQNPSSHQGATGTKLFGVSHLPSFSHMEASL